MRLDGPNIVLKLPNLYINVAFLVTFFSVRAIPAEKLSQQNKGYPEFFLIHDKLRSSSTAQQLIQLKLTEYPAYSLAFP